MRHEKWLIAGSSLLFTLLPVLLHGWPSTLSAQLASCCIVLAGLVLAWWRERPAMVLIAASGLVLVSVPGDPPFSNFSLVLLAAMAVIAGERFSSWQAWAAGAGVFVFIVSLYLITDDNGAGLWVLTLPGFVAGAALRLRREAVEALAERALELEQERALFTDLAVHNERARIAAELHDIVGHAISVMVIQAQAGQRLAERDPAAASQALAAIAASARQGRDDLRRLVDLLGGSEVATPDLSLVDQVVAHASRSGLDVTCRFEGDRDGLSGDAAHLTFRVVQEGLTNALRYAPGAAVRVLVSAAPSSRSVVVRVENSRGRAGPSPVTGSGAGLRGLRERVQSLGGVMTAGRTTSGGWVLEAQLPSA